MEMELVVMKKKPNQPVERMAAGGRRSRVRASWAAAIAHFCRSAGHRAHD
jgi:hypothetical protein